jgi:hypothetical protein
MEKIKTGSAQGASNYWQFVSSLRLFSRMNTPTGNSSAANRIAHHTSAADQLKRQPSASTVISW